MSIKFPSVPLSQVLAPIERPEAPQPGTTYRLFGVRWWGEGVYEREAVDGSQTQYTKLSRIEDNDIVINKIWARHGSVAVVQKGLAGCYGGSEFPTFLPDPTQLEPRWIHWLSKTAAFWSWCAEKSYGTSGKNRIRPEQFLAVEIPLPPLDEQRRIVTRIEALAARIAEARGLRQQAVAETSEILSSYHLALSGSRKIKISDCLQLDECSEKVELGKAYPQVGVRGFGQGLFPKEAVDSTMTSYRAFNRLFTGAVVLSQVKGWEGAIGVCPIELDNWYVSPEYRTFNCIPGQAAPEYLALIVPTPWFWMKLKQLSRGLGGRRERVRPELFLDMEIEMPTVEQQLYAVKAFSQLDALKRLQAETAAEMDALLPAVLDRAFRGELL